MLRVGIVGMGFMGWIHWLAYRRVPGTRVVAICETDPVKRSGDWRGIRGNFGPPGERTDLTGLATCESLETMLRRGGIDLLDVCLPPSLHEEAVIAGLEAGCDVLCEKPMALTPAACDAMVAAAARTRRRLFVAHVLPFFPEYAAARAVIDRGTYGRLLGGTFKRVISDPHWLKDFYDPTRIGGPLIDLHVHDAHLIRLLFGMPKNANSRGRLRGAVVSYCQSLFEFDDPTLVVSAVSGVITQPGRPFNHAFELHLERATMQFELAAFTDQSERLPLKILTDGGEILRPEMPAGDDLAGFVDEISEVAACLATGRPSPVLAGDLARDAILICHMQSESVFGRYLRRPLAPPPA